MAYDGGTTALGAVRPSSILGTPTFNLKQPCRAVLDFIVVFLEEAGLLRLSFGLLIIRSQLPVYGSLLFYRFGPI